MSQLMSKIKCTKLALKFWNRVHFGHIQSKILELKMYIESLQSLPQFEFVLNQEKMALKELDKIWLRERILWKAKAKDFWLMEGNANTHYFHKTTIVHWRYNHIHIFLHNSNVRFSGTVIIDDLLVSYYSNLFTSGMHSFPIDLQQLITPTITHTINYALLICPSFEEIIQAVRSIHNSKGLGLDGMSLFYKRFWNVVGQDVINAVAT